MEKVQQFQVNADTETGLWIGEPEFVCEVALSEWNQKQDTESAHFDTYEVEVDGESVTRAIQVNWVD